MASTTKSVNVEIYSRGADVLGEGPIWSSIDDRLYWLDIAGRELRTKGTSDLEATSWSLPHYPGCLAELGSGGMGVAMDDGIQRVELRSGEIQTVRRVPPRPPGMRFNDGKVDPCGRLWVGTMQDNFGSQGESIAIGGSKGVLYRFDPDGSVRIIEENIGVPNTLAWSTDLKRFYFADSLLGQIYAYDFDSESGDVWNKRVFFESPQHGIPDGSAIDVDGCLWNARWDDGAILRITPEGRLDRRIELPVPRPTSCIFGGNALDTLYITSATHGLTPAQRDQFPLSGCVFAIQGLAQGTPVPPLSCR